MTPREAIAYAWEDVPSDEVITGDSLADYLLRALMAAGYAVMPMEITPKIAERCYRWHSVASPTESALKAEDAEITALRTKLANAETAFHDALQATEANTLLRGFSYGEPTRNDLNNRLLDIKAILEGALSALAKDD